MSDPSREADPVGRLADDFVERYRRGERPSLSEYCRQHPALADRIRELFPALVMMEELGPHSDESVRGSVAPRGSLPRSKLGERLEQIGDYRILREIGRGGMGVVFEAEQISLGRHVALKVLPFHVTKDTIAMERFRREARAAARLHHTNIVPVFEVGQDRDVCYYAMQFIQGQGLDEVLVELQRLRHPKEPAAPGNSGQRWAAANPAVSVADALVHGRLNASVAADSNLNRRASTQSGLGNAREQGSPEWWATAADAPSGRVPPDWTVADDSGSPSTITARVNLSSVSESSPQHYFHSLARIAVQVADALEYAHNRGVIHRDIKPSNLLLDATGTVWVTDFGLAKTQGDELTHTGDLVGTVRYMAPERFHGGSDSRSDVYGLGVTLYELLTLQAAFDSPDRMRLIQQVTHAEPVPPRKIDPRVPRDLETIVLKAIAKEPGDRYSSAGAIASDLRQFLEDKPIRARRTSGTERLWRWCRRNRLVATLSAAVVLLILGLGLGGGVALLLRGERDRALVSELRATNAEAETREALARAVVFEREVQLRSRLARATAFRRSGEVGQRVKCLEEIRAAMEFQPPAAVRSELRDEATAAMGLIDLRQVWTRGVASVIGAQFDPNLDRYVVAEAFQHGEMVVRRVSDDAELDRLPFPGGSFSYATTNFSPNGRWLAAQYWGQDPRPLLRVWDFDSHSIILERRISSREPPLSVGETPYYAFHPNGRWFLYCSDNNDLVTFDFESKQEIRRWPLGLQPFSVSVDGEGKRVAVNSAAVPLVRIFEVESGREVASWNSDVGKGAMHWSNDGQLLATADFGRIYVTHVPRGQLLSVLQGHTARVSIVQFSPDGSLLATHSWDGTTRLWDPVTAETLLASSGEFLRFSRDGRRVGRLSEGKLSIWELTRGREFVTLQPAKFGNRDEDALAGFVRSADFSPDGRLLLTGSYDGPRVWDTETGIELAHLPIGQALPALFHPDGDGLVTAGVSGVLWWPIRRTIEQDAETVEFGPPSTLWQGPIPPGDKSAAWLPGGRQIAVHSGASIVILDVPGTGAPAREPTILPMRLADSASVAASADGKWIASGGWRQYEMQIWNMPSGTPARSLPASDSRHGSIFSICFSPDSRWLVSIADNPDAQGYYFWRTDTWERGPFVASPRAEQNIVFAPNSKLAALGIAPHEISLWDVSSQHEVVRLALPRQVVGFPARFNHDGTQLAVVKKTRAVLLWNLRALRDGLTSLGLDWDYQPFSPETARPSHRQLRAMVHTDGAPLSLGERSLRKIERYRRAFEANPESPSVCNSLAWVLATADESARDLDEAVVLAEKALRKNPDSPFIRNTVGLVYYRLGRYRDAVNALLPNTKTQRDPDLPLDLILLAMSHHQLGDRDHAHAFLELANRWNISSKTRSLEDAADLAAFRAEAEELLGK